MTIPSDTQIAELLADAKIIAMVGLTDSPGTPSYEVASYEQSQGYKVIPVNPQIKSALGHAAVPSVAAIPEPVDIVNIFAHGPVAEQAAKDAVQKRAKAVWLQPGADNPAAEQVTAQAGLMLIKDRCLKREHYRLLSHQPM
ncbi:MAG: CoA-binding protein [Alicyclobacillus sp.]|nr:CoA-binding protein [Alicyclobacillus sp.]